MTRELARNLLQDEDFVPYPSDTETAYFHNPGHTCHAADIQEDFLRLLGVTK